jgi:tRNA modification GTPase
MIGASEPPLVVEKELLLLENEIDLINKKLIIVANKIDELNELPKYFTEWDEYDTAFISAKRNVNIDDIRELLTQHVDKKNITDRTLLTNVRHYDIMLIIEEEIHKIEAGFSQQLPTDLLAFHIYIILDNLGQITGEVTTDDVLRVVFGRFCIGK